MTRYLSALPHCVACGCEPIGNLEDSVPYLLMFAPTAVNQLLDRSAGLGFPDANPVVTIIRAAETPFAASCPTD